MPVDMVLWLLVGTFLVGVLFALGVVYLAKKSAFNIIAMVRSFSYFTVVRDPSMNLNKKSNNTHND